MPPSVAESSQARHRAESGRRRSILEGHRMLGALGERWLSSCGAGGERHQRPLLLRQLRCSGHRAGAKSPTPGMPALAAATNGGGGPVAAAAAAAAAQSRRRRGPGRRRRRRRRVQGDQAPGVPVTGPSTLTAPRLPRRWPPPRRLPSPARRARPWRTPPSTGARLPRHVTPRREVSAGSHSPSLTPARGQPGG